MGVSAYFWILWTLWVVGAVHTQNSSDAAPIADDWCGTHYLHSQLLQSRQGNKQARKSRAQIQGLGNEHPWPVDGIEIPIVVHVVWHDEQVNISQVQIQSQIDILNQDFNAQNADLSTVPPVFQSLIGNPNIRFSLATRDPDGKPTNGVTRTQTSIFSFDMNEPERRADNRLKIATQGGQNGWPNDQYLNIWVSRLGGTFPVAGYAYLPDPEILDEAAWLDGVVVDHTFFGNGGTSRDPTGRTPTHEVGHWLDLYHIWGDTMQGSCNDTDHCNDTPNQFGPNRGRPTFPHVSCGNGSYSDMFMNHMDYSDHDLRVMFSKGQVERMHAALLGPRNSFFRSGVNKFILPTGFALHGTDGSFDFQVIDWDNDGHQDLVAIKKNNTGTSTTEIHVLSGASKFQTSLLQTSIGFHETDDADKFMLNADGDLVAIKKNIIGSNKNELHILSRSSNFRNYSLQTPIILPTSDDTSDYMMVDWNRDGFEDLVCIRKNNNGTNQIEVDILSGASNFLSYLLQTGTALTQESVILKFILADFNGDGRPDLVAISVSDNTVRRTRVQILSGASDLETFLLEIDTDLNLTDGSFDFVMVDWDHNGRLDLIAINKRRTGTDSMDVHVLSI